MASGPREHLVDFTNAARKQLSSLPPPVQKSLISRIEALGPVPRPPRVEKLKDRVNRYRIRIGDYRVVYEIYDDRLLVLIVRIGHRRDVYRP